jgi:hypothetical protein
MPSQKPPHILYRVHYDLAGPGRLYFDPGTMLLPYETCARSSCPAES